LSAKTRWSNEAGYDSDSNGRLLDTDAIGHTGAVWYDKDNPGVM
jgi:hypothetical protein